MYTGEIKIGKLVKANNFENGIEVTNVEMRENGIMAEVSMPLEQNVNVAKTAKIYISDKIMLKILSRYIDNDKPEESDEIEDAVY